MRLEGQTKMGYYPTPEITLGLLKAWLTVSGDGPRRYLDPCCGQGEALAEIAASQAETYGIELSDVRANAAQDRLAHVLNTAYEYAVLTPETFSLVLLNPPYDGEAATGGGKRMEETFLCDLPTTEALIPGGVLIYIIPHARINERVARHLAGWYTGLRCFKLPAEEYEVFKQVVIFGVRRDYVTPDGDTVKSVLAWKDGQHITGWTVEEEHELLPEVDESGNPKKKKVRKPTLANLPELTAGNRDAKRIVPETPLKGKGGRPFRFQYNAVSDEDFLREAETAAARLDGGRAWLDLVPPLEPPVIEPAMTPKRGHIAMQVSGGLLGTNMVTDPSGRAMLLKGNVDKIQVRKQEANLDEEAVAAWDDEDDDKKTLKKVEIEEQFRTLLSTLTEDGTLTTLTDPAEIAPLLEQYVGQLAEVVQARNTPQYDLQPDPWEWAVFDTLSKGRKLPGRNETGLTDFQRHLAIALGRLCRKHGAGFCNQEMGGGKAQPLHADVLTPTGWKKMGDIQVGDEVIGADGRPTQVVVVFPQGQQDLHRVTFTDGSWAECTEDHLWTVQTPLNKWKGKAVKTMTLREIMDRGLAHSNGNLQHFIPLVRPVQFAERALPLDPYLVGVLLGDGSLTTSGSVSLTTADSEVMRRVASILPKKLAVRHTARYTWRITKGYRGGAPSEIDNPVLTALRQLGLMGHRAEKKFIPDPYKLASVQQRIALLQGLLDTDGYVRPQSCTVEYSTASPQLADDVTFLVQSLGGTVSHHIKHPKYTYKGNVRQGQTSHRLTIGLPHEIKPFHLSRKMAEYRPYTKYPPSRAIKAVDKVGSAPVQCIKVAAGDGLYVTNNCVVTHNTTVGIAIAEYLRVSDARRGKPQTAYPAMVVGPGIVTGQENWPKEIPEVTPGAAGKVVVVGAKPVPKPVRIGVYLKDLGLTPDEGDFEGKNVQWAVNTIRRTAKKQKVTLSEELVAALHESLERAEKNPPARRRGAKAPNLLDGRIGGFHWLGLAVPRDPNSEEDLRGKYSLAQFIAEHRAGALPEKSFAIVSYETAKLGSGRVPAMNTKRLRVRWTDEDGHRRSEIRAVCACPQCGSVVAREYDEESGEPLDLVTPKQAEEFIAFKRRYCQVPASRRVWDADKGQHVVKTHDGDGNRYVCGAPLFENTGLRRIAAADYAKKKAKGVFGLCLVDEVHKAKAKGTGVGWALTALVNAARYTVGLTGTLFGGYSTSIFWLLYRLTGEVRQQFGFNDEHRWTEKYGLLKRTFYTDQEAPAEDGAFTGTRFFETVSEKPGISPAIAGLGLKYCTFSSLKDIGLPLPQYSEEIVRIEMMEAMKAQYAEADGSATKSGLFRWALDTMEEETGKGAISVWLNTALNRPDAMFRGEQVFFNRRLTGRGRFAVRQRELAAEFDPVAPEGVWLPKEEWTAKQALAEHMQGRKTLIYVRQTGERDVQPRLQACLAARGLRVGILRPSLAPEKRATWIRRHADEFDVLLTNARLVEVGLNLTMFATAIFFGTPVTGH